VTPAVDTFPIGETRSLQARAETANGQLVTGTAAFTSSDPAVASVTQAGTVTAIRMGPVTITATIGGIAGQAALRIAPTVTIGPELPSLFAGDTLHLAWDVRQEVGGPPGPQPAFASRSAQIASVTPTGVVTGIQPGITTIVGSFDVSAESLEVVVLAPRTGANREIAAACSQARRLCLYGADVDTVSPPGVQLGPYAWSPGGARIAFGPLDDQSGPQVWVANADWSGASERGPGFLDETPWSPDGLSLVFEDLNQKISVLSLQTGTQRRLTMDQTAAERHPQFSPDGRRVAFQREVVPGDNRLWWSTLTVPAVAKPVPVPGSVIESSWSPDGRWLAVNTNQVSPTPWWGVWVVRPDGTGLRPISPNCGPGLTCTAGIIYTGAAWSPDGKLIAFTWLDNSVSPTGFGWEIRSFTSGELVARHVALDIIIGPDWSPDGQRLAWVTSWRLYTSLVNGTDIQQLGADSVLGVPRWRPSPD
jgi:Tol biopolymer transport system component